MRVAKRVALAAVIILVFLFVIAPAAEWWTNEWPVGLYIMPV